MQLVPYPGVGLDIAALCQKLCSSPLLTSMVDSVMIITFSPNSISKPHKFYHISSVTKIHEPDSKPNLETSTKKRSRTLHPTHSTQLRSISKPHKTNTPTNRLPPARKQHTPYSPRTLRRSNPIHSQSLTAAIRQPLGIHVERHSQRTRSRLIHRRGR